jgi:hypothetical protein
MAERKSGPVKPPVIDLTARPADTRAEVPADKADAPADKAAAPAATASTEQATAKAPPERPAAETPATPPAAPRRRVWPAALAGAIGGAVLGAIIAVAVSYGLAERGYWPGERARAGQVADLEQRLAALEAAGPAAQTAITDLSGKFAALQADIGQRLDGASTALAAVQQSVAKLQAAPAADLGPIEAQLRTVSSRLDAVAAGASSADAGALAANLATVQQDLAALSQKVGALTDRVAAGDTTTKELKAELDSAKAAIDQAAAAPTPKAIASAMQLPLLISALEADFNGGRPYATDLGNVAAAIPEARVPAAVSAAADTGLPAPAELAAAFEAKMPDIIAARPTPADAGWTTQLGDWARNVLALRSEGAEAGDGPDAVLSRLEAAVKRHDFAGAVTLLKQLPPPMQQAAGDVAGRLEAAAAAQAFLTDLRRTALAPISGAAQ